MAIKNRYEFIYYVACTNANPNGDPRYGKYSESRSANYAGIYF